MKVLNQFPEVELYWLLNGTGHFPSTSAIKQHRVSEEFANQTEKGHIPPLADLSSKISAESNKTGELRKKASEIERIVLFYKDGSFKLYQ